MIRLAKQAKQEGRSQTILFNLCGHGNFDMSAYEQYFAGEMVDYAYPEAEVAKAMESVPAV